MKKILCLLSLFAASGFAAPLPDSAKVGEFYAGCQAYTFRMFDLMEALDKIAVAGGKTVEVIVKDDASVDARPVVTLLTEEDIEMLLSDRPTYGKAPGKPGGNVR